MCNIIVVQAMRLQCCCCCCRCSCIERKSIDRLWYTARLKQEVVYSTLRKLLHNTCTLVFFSLFLFFFRIFLVHLVPIPLACIFFEICAFFCDFSCRSFPQFVYISFSPLCVHCTAMHRMLLVYSL